MAISDSNYGRVAYIAESTLGTTPTSTPAWKTLRVTSSDFAVQKDTSISDELRTDRMVAALNEIAASSSGSVNFELSLGGTFDDFLQAALCGTWTTAINNTACTATAATSKITKSAGWSNASVGQWVYATGFTTPANNGWHRITAVGVNDITVASTLVDDTGGTVRGKMLRNGTVKRSFSIEQGFTDINQYFVFAGQRVGTMALEVSSGAIVTGSFGFQGTTSTVAQTAHYSANSGSLAAATTTQTVNATSNVGSVLEAAAYTALTTGIQGISINVDNALRNQAAVGNKYPIGVGYGRQTITGSLNAYFEDVSLYTKFLNHTATALSFGFTDGASPANGLRITLPKVYFSSSAPSIPGTDQDVMQSLEWTAIYDGTSCQIQIDAIA